MHIMLHLINISTRSRKKRVSTTGILVENSPKTTFLTALEKTCPKRNTLNTVEYVLNKNYLIYISGKTNNQSLFVFTFFGLSSRLFQSFLFVLRRVEMKTFETAFEI